MHDEGAGIIVDEEVVFSIIDDMLRESDEQTDESKREVLVNAVVELKQLLNDSWETGVYTTTLSTIPSAGLGSRSRSTRTKNDRKGALRDSPAVERQRRRSISIGDYSSSPNDVTGTSTVREEVAEARALRLQSTIDTLSSVLFASERARLQLSSVARDLRDSCASASSSAPGSDTVSVDMPRALLERLEHALAVEATTVHQSYNPAPPSTLVRGRSAESANEGLLSSGGSSTSLTVPSSGAPSSPERTPERRLRREGSRGKFRQLFSRRSSVNLRFDDENDARGGLGSSSGDRDETPITIDRSGGTLASSGRRKLLTKSTGGDRTSSSERNGGGSHGSAPTHSFSNVHTINFETDHVTLHEKLGQGGTARVYRATVRGFSVACKVFFSSEYMSELELDLVRSEIVMMESLYHPNIVNTLGHDFAEVSQTLLYMELFPQTLRDFLDEARALGLFFDSVMVHNFAQQVASGLNYLHTLVVPIVHRDLKAENIFIAKDGLGREPVLKIGDFGESQRLLKRAGTDDPAAGRGNVGTPEFMAPELFSKSFKPSLSGHQKVDVWAYGMVLFELLTLDIPYRSDGVDCFDMLDHVKRGNRPALPERIEEAVELAPYVKLHRQCIHLRPDVRPGMSEILKRLGKAASVQNRRDYRRIVRSELTHALLEAVDQNDLREVRRLVTLKQADFYARDEDGCTAIELALSLERGEILRFFFDSLIPSVVNEHLLCRHLNEQTGLALIHTMVSGKGAGGADDETIMRIVKQVPNLSLNVRSANGNTALHYMCNRNTSPGIASLVNVFLAQGADPNVSNRAGETPLHRAVLNSSADARPRLIATLLAAGANPNHMSSRQNTPLHFAVAMRRSDCLQPLIDGGADMSLVDADGRTPLEIAKRENFVEAVSILKRALDVEARRL
jgi:ankyrin repeat protein